MQIHSYIAPFPEGEAEVEALKSWLQGYISQANYLHINDLRHLKIALILASKEVIKILDPRLENLIHEARQADSSIEAEFDDFWASRIIDFESILEDDSRQVRYLNREKTAAFLLGARDEIEWMLNEIRRLDLHIDHARDAIRGGRRRSFVYRPTERRHGDLDRAPSEVAEAAAAGGADEDEGMADNKFFDAREERSATPQPQNGTSDTVMHSIETMDGQKERQRRSATPEREVEEDEVKDEDRRDSGSGGAAAQ